MFGLSGMKTDCSSTDRAGSTPGGDGVVLSMEDADRNSGYQPRRSRASGAAFRLIITPSVLASTREDILGPVNTLLCLEVVEGVRPQGKTEMSCVA